MKNFLYFFVFLIISSNCVFAQHIDSFDNMPILENLPKNAYGYFPIEQRDEKYKKFLCSSVKITVSGASGSGSIIYYDSKKNLAYVASCGHLWSEGTMNVEQGRLKNKKCKVIVYYHNDKKLKSPSSYDANVIFYSNVSSLDTSLVTFVPDWSPNYYPIASLNYKYKIGSIAHSCGCDHGSEVAHYEVKIEEAKNDIVTYGNSPRPGRSGGGLMDDDCNYIGTCWGTQFVDGSGEGFFTTLEDIHKFWGKQKGYEFLLNVKSKINLAPIIPIKDKNKEKIYLPEYILLP